MTPEQAVLKLKAILTDKGTNLSLVQQHDMELAIVIFEDMVIKSKGGK